VRLARNLNFLEPAAFVAGRKRERKTDERRDHCESAFHAASPGAICGRTLSSTARLDKDAQGRNKRLALLARAKFVSAVLQLRQSRV